MNRTFSLMASDFPMQNLFLIDSALKVTVLLIVASVVVLMLRRDSAATRHLVWLVAMAATLVVPVMSALLPAWRVLPDWAGLSRTAIAESVSVRSPAVRPVEPIKLPDPVQLVVDDEPLPFRSQFDVKVSKHQPAVATPASITKPVIGHWRTARPEI